MKIAAEYNITLLIWIRYGVFYEYCKWWCNTDGDHDDPIINFELWWKRELMKPSGFREING